MSQAILTPEKLKELEDLPNDPPRSKLAPVSVVHSRVARTTEPAHELHAHRETTRGEMQLPYQRAVIA